MAKFYKLVVFVPQNLADEMRELLGKMGAGRIGNYDYASFSVLGTGRFRPLEGAHPTIGKIGNIDSVSEERIETVVSEEQLESVVAEVRKSHPYEEPVIDVYPLLAPPYHGGEGRDV